MYIVTGGAGFIGSNIVRGLNEKGITDILVVDNLKNSSKFLNLVDCQIADYIDKQDFRASIEKGSLTLKPTVIFHQGACSDTTEYDGSYMMDNNFTYSKRALHYALERKTPFIYASSAAVYGGASQFQETPENEKPLNIYGYSKLLFDRYVQNILSKIKTTVIGLRYFNVYGPHEAHKNKMASVVYQLYQQRKSTGILKLFEGTDGYGNGEQRRDFIYIDDVVKINLFFLNQQNKKGVLNAGTGKSRSFNEVAKTLIHLHCNGKLTYIPFPEKLKEKYQSFTQADISTLTKMIGYFDFTSIEEGIHKYYTYLKPLTEKNCLLTKAPT